VNGEKGGGRNNTGEGILQPPTNTPGRKKRAKRNTGSIRSRKERRQRIDRWTQQGITIGSINMNGFSLFKTFLLIIKHNLDVICIQEMWLPQATIQPKIPGYTLLEQRRE
jgi:hypothetical protein